MCLRLVPLVSMSSGLRIRALYAYSTNILWAPASNLSIASALSAATLICSNTRRLVIAPEVFSLLPKLLSDIPIRLFPYGS